MKVAAVRLTKFTSIIRNSKELNSLVYVKAFEVISKIKRNE